MPMAQLEVDNATVISDINTLQGLENHPLPIDSIKPSNAVDGQTAAI